MAARCQSTVPLLPAVEASAVGSESSGSQGGCCHVVSVDGYIADDNDDVGPLHEWYFTGDIELTEGGDAKVSKSLT